MRIRSKQRRSREVVGERSERRLKALAVMEDWSGCVGRLDALGTRGVVSREMLRWACYAVGSF
jgi:hypothetical protein